MNKAEPTNIRFHNEGSTVRLHQLDSMRGLAAFAVLFAHFIASFPVAAFDPWLRIWPLSIIHDGAAAVCLFFVLSGFVLALKYLSDERQSKELNLSVYLINRICRIWLPFAVVLLISWQLQSSFWFGHDPSGAGSLWFRNIWSEQSEISGLLRQLSFRHVSTASQLMPQDWTLGEEMKFSLLLPIIVVLALRGASWLLFTVVLLVGILGQSHFTLHFCLGVALAYFQKPLGILMGKLNLSTKIAYAAAAFLLYGARGWIPLDSTHRPSELALWFIAAIGSVMLVLGALSFKEWIKLLRSRALAFCGAISYSFYLWHFVIILFLSKWSCRLIYPKQAATEVSHWVFALMVNFFACFAIATVSYLLIEKPAIQFGRKICKIWTATLRRVSTSGRLT